MQQENWSPRAKELVEQLIADLPDEKLADSHARRLNALPDGWLITTTEIFHHPI